MINMIQGKFRRFRNHPDIIVSVYLCSFDLSKQRIVSYRLFNSETSQQSRLINSQAYTSEP